MAGLNLKIKNKISIGNLIAVLTVGFVLLSGVFFYSQNFLEDKAYDFFIKLTTHKKGSADIVTVVIDDQSIGKIGRWPWKRSYYADIFDYLEHYGKAKAIVFDSIIISYGDKKDDQIFFKRVGNLKNIITGVFFSRQKDFFSNRDEKFLDNCLKNKFALNVFDERPPEIIHNTAYLSSSYTLKELFSSVSGIGSVLTPSDSDGVIRKTEPVILYKNTYYPSLALAVWAKLNKNQSIIIDEKFLTSKNGALKIPIHSSNDGMHYYIKWYNSDNTADNPYPYKAISAWKVLKSYQNLKNNVKPETAPDLFRDKIVVVGVTATALKDIRNTSVEKDYPGVFIQASSIDNILNNNFMHKPSGLVRLIVLLTALLTTITAVLLLSPLYSSLIVSMLMVGYLCICLMISYPNNYALDIVTPEAFMTCALLIGYGYKYFLADNNKRKIEKIMAKYVSKNVMDDILKNVEGTKLGGKRAEITVLFADIRGFTTISEEYEPEEISEMLNLYFSEMVPIIMKYNGTLNKFMGDAFLSIFGAPVEYPDHAQNAVMCAVEMIEKVQEIQKKWLLEGKPKIDIGIGINTGIAFVGNVGSEDRLEYTAIGDNVNIADRLEAFNKKYNTSVLISELTYEKIREMVEVIEVDSVLFERKTGPIKIYELKGLKNICYDSDRKENRESKPDKKGN